MNFTPIEQIIRAYVVFEEPPNAKGFFPVLCKVCNDHGKKGKRAGFKFEGTAVGYNCFNCGHRASFDSNSPEPVSKAMARVFRAYNIPEADWVKAINPDAAPTETASSDGQSSLTFPPVLTLPPYFYPLTDDPSDDMAQVALEYLRSRSIDWTQHPFHIVHPDGSASNWFGRLIIPLFFRQQLIFWQGRDLLNIRTKKYLSPSVEKNAVMGGFDHIFERSPHPLYVTEGWFDSFHLRGVSVMGNQMTADQIAWLNQTPRQKIIIPDRFGDGHLLARQAVSLGWGVSTPDIGSCKDINDAVCKYGQLYTLQSIMDSTSTGFEAQVNIDLYCTRKKK